MTSNRTLEQMTSADRARLRGHITIREVRKGDTLIAQGAPVEEVYLPETALLTNAIEFADGRRAEAYVIGSEGVGGLMPTLAREPSSWTVSVKASGTVYALPADVLIESLEASPTLRAQLLRLANEHQARAIASAACLTLHHASARLAYFLLSVAERSGEDVIHLTQDEMSTFLNVQRTTVNAAAKELKAKGAIRYLRGTVRILDRQVLSDVCCPCRRLETDRARPLEQSSGNASV